MDTVTETLKGVLDKTSTIPHEYFSTISWGFAIAGICLILISLVIGVLYVSIFAKPKPAVRQQPSLATKKKEDAPKETIVHYEDLPVIPGRIGEILALNGFLSIGPTTKIFLRVLDILKRSTYDLRWRYKTPCFMMIGPEKSGKSSLLNSLNLEQLSNEEEPMWKLFKEGIIFEFPKSDVSEQKFWSFIGELFLFIRPRRPLDGIIVTVPADLLLSNNANVAKTAKDTFDNIFQFQRDINFRLPIYIIVTKSDSIRGFADFAQLLHHDMRQQMFGWSNPYTLNTQFSTKWINEIFDTIAVGINRAILSFAHTKNPSETLENALLFPMYFNKIKPALNDYLTTMFKTHNPEDGLIFRGIYFVGEQKNIEIPTHELMEPNVLAPKNALDFDVHISLSVNNRLYFIQDLFSEKIFRESNIAAPLRGETPEMHQTEFKRQCIYVSVTAGVIFGWMFGNYNIRKKITQYTTNMNEVLSSMRKIAKIENSLSNVDDKFQIEQYTSELLSRVPKVKWYDCFSIFVPQSWFSNVRKNLTDTVNLVCDSVLSRAIYIDLNLDTHRFLEKTGDASKKRAPKSDLFDINSFESFHKLRDFATKAKQMRQMGQQYNAMRTKGDGKELINITKELFKDKFEDTLELDNHVPNENLVIPQFDMAFFNQNAEKSLKIIFSDFLHDVLDVTVEKILQSLASDVEKFLKASHNSSLEYSTQDLAKLYNKCKLVKDLLKNQNFAWIKQNHFVPTVEYANIMNELRASDFISNGCISQLLAQGETEFAQFKERLRKYKTQMTDNLLKSNMSGISDGLEILLKELKFLLDKPFICSTPYGKLVTSIPDEKMLIWDQKRLNSLAKLVDKYDEFEADIPPEIRARFFEDYRAISKKCFYPVIQAMVGSAEILQDIPLGRSGSLLEEVYKKQAVNIRAVTTSLPKIIKIIDEIQNDDHLPDCGVITMIINHYLEYLNRIDALFNAEKPYSAKSAVFDGWDGEHSPRYLNIENQHDLRQYLATQFEHIKFLAKDLAEPVVDFLSIPSVYEHIKNTVLLNKWKDIVVSVNDYLEKKPGNSIAALEEFLSQTLSKVSLDTFDEQGDIRNFSEAGGDYFIQTRSSVAKSLLSRADEVKYDRASKSYMKVRDFFNTRLKGKAPFALTNKDASLRDVELFVQLYDQHCKGMYSTLKKHKNEKAVNEQSLDFMRDLEQLMPFLKIWVQHSKGSDENSAVMLFSVNIRPDPRMEAYTSSVIERNFKINDAIIKDDKNGVYFNNDNISVVFKWVKSSDEKPKTTTSSQLVASGNSATFKANGKWALFKMIEQHKINKETDNPNGVLVKFEVPISASGKDAKSIMVMKITPMMKDKDNINPITWPIFPKNAPDLHTKEEEEENIDSSSSETISSTTSENNVENDGGITPVEDSGDSNEIERFSDATPSSTDDSSED